MATLVEGNCEKCTGEFRGVKFLFGLPKIGFWKRELHRTDLAISQPELASYLAIKEESLVFHSFLTRSQIFLMVQYLFWLFQPSTYHVKVISLFLLSDV